MTHVNGLTFDAAHAHHKTYDLDGLEIHLIHRNDLVLNKRSSGRGKGPANVRSLQLIEVYWNGQKLEVYEEPAPQSSPSSDSGEPEDAAAEWKHGIANQFHGKALKTAVRLAQAATMRRHSPQSSIFSKTNTAGLLIVARYVLFGLYLVNSASLTASEPPPAPEVSGPGFMFGGYYSPFAWQVVQHPSLFITNHYLSISKSSTIR